MVVTSEITVRQRCSKNLSHNACRKFSKICLQSAIIAFNTVLLGLCEKASEQGNINTLDYNSVCVCERRRCTFPIKLLRCKPSTSVDGNYMCSLNGADEITAVL